MMNVSAKKGYHPEVGDKKEKRMDEGRGNPKQQNCREPNGRYILGRAKIDSDCNKFVKR